MGHFGWESFNIKVDVLFLSLISLGRNGDSKARTMAGKTKLMSKLASITRSCVRRASFLPLTLDQGQNLWVSLANKSVNPKTKLKRVFSGNS